MSGRFARIFMFQLIFIVLILMSIYLLYGEYAEKKIRKGLQVEVSNELTLFNASLDNLMQQIKNMSVQFSLHPAINALLKDTYNVSKFDYLVVRDEMTQIASSNELIYSMYIHSLITDKVLTTREGIYDRKEFYDRNLLSDYMNEGYIKPDYQSRTLVEQGDKPVKLLTVIQKLPIYNKVALGSLVVNVREDALIESLNQINGNLAGHMFIDKNRIMNWDREGLSEDEILHISAELDRKEAGFIQVGSKNKIYHAIFLKGKSLNWTYVKMISEELYQSLLNEEKQYAIRIMAILFVIFLGASFFMLLKMIAPWKELLSRLTPASPLPKKRRFLSDDVKSVNHTIDEMLQENKLFHQTFEEQLQIVREKLLMDLLWSQMDDRVQLKERMKYCQVEFPDAKFIVLVAAIDKLTNEGIIDYPNLLASKIHAKHVIEHHFSRKVPIQGILLDENYSAFILNIGNEVKQEWVRKAFATACVDINKTLQERNSGVVSFIFGPAVDDVYRLRDSFLPARRRVNYRSFFQVNYAFYDESLENSDYVYPMHLQKEIINGIKMGNPETIRNAVDHLFDHTEGMGQSVYSDIQQALSLLLSGVMSELWMQGEDLRGLLSVSKVRKILECENKEKLKEQSYEHFLVVMNMVSCEHTSETNKKVAQIIEIMEQRFTEDFSIQQLADEVILTPAYLCRIFKEATGRTPLEYLTYQRIQHSLDLLSIRELTIKEIAERVGYREVRSYIRFFKRQEGVTPGVYRNHLIQI